jgi:hypothetical protein
MSMTPVGACNHHGGVHVHIPLGENVMRELLARGEIPVPSAVCLSVENPDLRRRVVGHANFSELRLADGSWGGGFLELPEISRDALNRRGIHEDAEQIEYDMGILWRPSPTIIPGGDARWTYACDDPALLEDPNRLITDALDRWKEEHDKAARHNEDQHEQLSRYLEYGLQALDREAHEARSVADRALEYLDIRQLPKGTRQLIADALDKLDDILEDYEDFRTHEYDCLPSDLPPWRVGTATRRLRQALDQAEKANAARASQAKQLQTDVAWALAHSALLSPATLAALTVGRAASVANRLRRARREAERPGWIPRASLKGYPNPYRGNSPSALALLDAAQEVDPKARLVWWESPEWAGPVVIGHWRTTEMLLVGDEATPLLERRQ